MMHNRVMEGKKLQSALLDAPWGARRSYAVLGPCWAANAENNGFTVFFGGQAAEGRGSAEGDGGGLGSPPGSLS